MYRTVYWHRQVRSATAMIKKALLGGLEAKLIAPEELYDLDDQGLFALMGRRSHPLFSLADKVREGRLYASAAEFPYGGEYRDLLDIGKRSQYEENLAGALREAGIAIQPGEVIIDVPEPVSFETGLFVRDEDCCFAKSSSAFNAETVDSFVKTLYTIRVFVEPSHEGNIKSLPAFPSILHIKKKWLHL
jgi:HD superfamily phosphohydrolase